MTDSQTLQIEGIGRVLFERSARARRVLISIRPHKDIRVRVAIPWRTSFKSAIDFVHKKEGWIKRHLVKVREYETQKKISNEVFQSIDKAKARKEITRRLEQLARKGGFTYNRVAIRNQRTRWGSCSSKGNINLNLKLAALPPELMDYVIYHELVHMRVHNHSQKFWRELDKYVGNGKAKARELVEYGMVVL